MIMKEKLNLEKEKCKYCNGLISWGKKIDGRLDETPFSQVFHLFNLGNWDQSIEKIPILLKISRANRKLFNFFSCA